MISNIKNNENYNYYCTVCKSKKIQGICKCHSIEINPKKHKRHNSQYNPRNNNNF
jgi:predicted RNA-binding protein with PUA-like domain